MRFCGVPTITMAVMLTVLCFTGQETKAGRLFGNATLSYEHVRQQTDTEVRDDVTRESAIINWEDVLFYKNHIRLTANLQRRELSFSDYHEFRPIYYFDLVSYGYGVNVRYSPYTRRSLTASGVDLIDVYYRDWRVTSALNYVGYPTVNVVYSRLSNFDKEEVHRFDAYNRNWVAESSYSLDPVSLRANYNNLKQVNQLSGGIQTTTETYSSTVGFSRNFARVGYLSATYNYYNTQRESNSVISQDSRTHSVNSIVILNAIERLTANASYSGRFLTARQQTQTIEDQNQNISAQAEFSPTGYLSFQAGKGYQEIKRDAVGEGDNVTEYINLGATATRYFRNGVDTRLTYNRTIFQQSPRLATVTDTTGAAVGTVNAGEYSLDTYQASLNFYARKYIRTYVDLSLLHDSDPVDEQRRYQLTRSLDVRVNFSRRLEGRFRLAAQYLGSTLTLSRAFSENYNLGLTFIPQSNLNMNATYIYTQYNSGTRSSLSSVTSYISYSFRRAFTAYLSFNEQKQTRELVLGGEDPVETETRPRTLNGQLLMYLSRKTTLSVGYLRSRAQSALGEKIVNESIQSVLSIQI